MPRAVLMAPRAFACRCLSSSSIRPDMSALHDTAATHSAPAHRSSRTMVVAAALGNGLEFFDFTVYSFFSALIGRLFFPAHDELSSLMMSLATFGVGFVVRPLGGVVIGAYADRAGRKPALIFTVLLMALGTGLIGLAPTYAQIGVAAPALIVLGRLMQGFSAGGEVGAATTLLMEAGREGRRGLLVSWQMASQGGAALAGALIAVLLSKSLSHEQLLAWGWRVPFLIGLAIGPVGFFLRARLDESLPGTHEPSLESKRSPLPLRQIVAGTLLVIGGTATMYTIVFFLPAFLSLTLGMPAATAAVSGCAAGVVLLVGSPLAGKLADRLTRRKPLLYAVSIASLAVLFPAFRALATWPSIGTALLVVVVLIGLMTLSSPAGFLMILESLRPDVRATSLGIIYAVGVTLFGGFAQLVVSGLWRATGSFYAPAWYVAACALVSLVGIALFRENK
jgi:MFS transporter, MHS family, proline/betaine transporter